MGKKFKLGFLDIFLYFVLFALFVYGAEEVRMLKGKLLIVLALVVGGVYEYHHLKNTNVLSKYLATYNKLRRLIFGTDHS